MADSWKEEAGNPTVSESQVMLSQDPPGEASLLVEELQAEDQTTGIQEPTRRKHRSPFRPRTKDDGSARSPSPASMSSASRPQTASSQIPTQTSTSNDISGRPFARAPSNHNMSGLLRRRTSKLGDASDEAYPSLDKTNSIMARKSLGGDTERDKPKAFVPVGVSRLHLVEFPDLIMKPIYWSPINDMSSVIRATWFYKENMSPVPADVVNQLEVGFEFVKPFAETYQDELDACVENGAAAELKVVHKLWPVEPKQSRPSTATDTFDDDFVSMSKDAETILPEAQVNTAADRRKQPKPRMYETYSVVYVDKANAQILKPSLLPSPKQSRTPLRAIRKGRQIGIAVVRGFDRKAWQKLHPPPKMDNKAAHAKVGAYMSQSGDAATRVRRMSCVTCDNDAKKPQVSDLVLVVHGIGQKLSERVDSFHFTHAINELRREFNVELSAESLKGNLEENKGIMVLPVNWRLTVSFEEDAKPAEASAESNKYQLKDITPDSLQGIRSLISDVMLDIPYYLSHHKEKMTSAVIREANRVYRLWCRNNPGFRQHGRVHVLAHSLGAAMVVDILSHQPTRVPEDLDLMHGKPSCNMFEFNTTNLFCCGSPAGFFLLLNNANLVPRKGLDKPGMEGQDHGPGIAGEAGQFGCLSVDNIYNVIHRNDPISYQLNACVDSQLAASLQKATVPSASVGLFNRVGNTLRWTSALGTDVYSSNAPVGRPHMQQMPSTVELETHNFTKEEIAEKRMYLLNENGQIDYFLNAGGGALDIQYLNMLGAHSSYWLLQDFVKFLVVEIGRKPGKENTLPVLRAVKRREYKKGSIA